MLTLVIHVCNINRDFFQNEKRFTHCFTVGLCPPVHRPWHIYSTKYQVSFFCSFAAENTIFLFEDSQHETRRFFCGPQRISEQHLQRHFFAKREPLWSHTTAETAGECLQVPVVTYHWTVVCSTISERLVHDYPTRIPNILAAKYFGHPHQEVATQTHDPKGRKRARISPNWLQTFLTLA